MGISQPTKVQLEALPIALAGKDIQVSASTGTGKTLAYLLPTFHKLIATPAEARTGSRALILLPTRELAEQVFKLCKRLAESCDLTTVFITGGQEANYQAAKLRRDPDIIVATPGRIIQHLDSGAAILKDVNTAILDEADRMLDMGFKDDVLRIIEDVPAARQTLLLSATLNHKGIKDVSKRILNTPESLILNVAQDAHENLTHQFVLSDEFDHKTKLVEALIRQTNTERAIVFVNKIETAEKLCDALGNSLDVDTLHGDLRQDERKIVTRRFRQQRFQILIATDVAARGLDIDNLALVINFDVPRSGDEYVHRAGRTGRGSATGLVISLVAAHDWNLIQGIQRYLKQKFEPLEIASLKAKFKGDIQRRKKKNPKGQTKSKSKTRARDQKNKGKRRKPAAKAVNTDGLAPPKRPPSN